MALSAVLQSFFILVIVLAYSGVVWKSLDSYFRDEFKKHLAEDTKSLQKLKLERIAKMKEKLELNRLQSGSGVVQPQIQEHSGVQDGAIVDVSDNCKHQEQPADKYKIEKKGGENSFDGEMCPFVPPLDGTVDDNGG